MFLTKKRKKKKSLQGAGNLDPPTPTPSLKKKEEEEGLFSSSVIQVFNLGAFSNDPVKLKHDNV